MTRIRRSHQQVTDKIQISKVSNCINDLNNIKTYLSIYVYELYREVNHPAYFIFSNCRIKIKCLTYLSMLTSIFAKRVH
jgi:hypothetical protein